MNPVVTVERMSYGSDAVAHLPGGKTVFVEGGAPGDVLEINVIEEKPNYARAQIASIKEPSAVRVTLPAKRCDSTGCAPWQHLSYEAQLEAKRDVVIGALVHTAGFDKSRAYASVAQTHPCQRQWGYRNKLELGARTDEGGKFQLGFYKEGTHDLIPSQTALLAHKEIAKAPRALAGALRYAQGKKDLGIYRIGVRHSDVTKELEIALWTPPSGFPRSTVAQTLADALPATSIVRVLADPGMMRKVKKVEVLSGRGYWRDEIDGVRFSTAAPSFFQVNSAQAGYLVRQVRNNLGESGNISGMSIADLYAGGGTFAINLARAGADVVAVEAAASSIRDLRHNAVQNSVDVRAVGGNAALELKGLGKLDALVVDPPRAGLAKNVPRDIANAGPGKVAYVSCNPQTLARDIARLENVGYTLTSLEPVDMFPQTYHVECVAIFTRES